MLPEHNMIATIWDHLRVLETAGMSAGIHGAFSITFTLLLRMPVTFRRLARIRL